MFPRGVCAWGIIAYVFPKCFDSAKSVSIPDGTAFKLGAGR
jgi:hypothetical protein